MKNHCVLVVFLDLWSYWNNHYNKVENSGDFSSRLNYIPYKSFFNFHKPQQESLPETEKALLIQLSSISKISLKIVNDSLGQFGSMWQACDFRFGRVLSTIFFFALLQVNHHFYKFNSSLLLNFSQFTSKVDHMNVRWMIAISKCRKIHSNITQKRNLYFMIPTG